MKLLHLLAASCFCLLITSSGHLHPLQVENCDSTSRLVVDEDDNGKFRLERGVNSRSTKLEVLEKELLRELLVDEITTELRARKGENENVEEKSAEKKEESSVETEMKSAEKKEESSVETEMKSAEKKEQSSVETEMKSAEEEEEESLEEEAKADCNDYTDPVERFGCFMRAAMNSIPENQQLTEEQIANLNAQMYFATGGNGRGTWKKSMSDSDATQSDANTANEEKVVVNTRQFLKNIADVLTHSHKSAEDTVDRVEKQLQQVATEKEVQLDTVADEAQSNVEKKVLETVDVEDTKVEESVEKKENNDHLSEKRQKLLELLESLGY